MRGVHKLLIPITVRNSDQIAFGLAKEETNFNSTIFFTDNPDIPSVSPDLQALEFFAEEDDAQKLGLDGTQVIHFNTTYNVSFLMLSCIN